MTGDTNEQKTSDTTSISILKMYSFEIYLQMNGPESTILLMSTQATI